MSSRANIKRTLNFYNIADSRGPAGSIASESNNIIIPYLVWSHKLRQSLASKGIYDITLVVGNYEINIEAKSYNDIASVQVYK